jgi:hypothetical protein
MYSAGLVEKYEIKEKTISNSKTTLTVDVWVSSSKLADMLIPVGKSNGNINGDQLASLEKSRINEQLSGDKLIQMVANDFPFRAIKVDIKDTQLSSYNRESKFLVGVYPFLSINSSSSYNLFSRVDISMFLFI